MAYVIGQACCKDASCAVVCPVDAIHPTPHEPEFLTAEMLYIDPGTCVDCGLCAKACPVGAISYELDLTSPEAPFRDLNAHFYRDPMTRGQARIAARRQGRGWDPSAEAPELKVAIVGSGPAAAFAAFELMQQRNARVDVFERLAAVGGLSRYGVAPDHQETKAAVSFLAPLMNEPHFRLFLNVEVGLTITHEDLTSRYHAVIYAVGAGRERRLGIPGEDLPGSHSAGEFVGWYNGYPAHSGQTFDLSGHRAVVIGNGNVAVDVARVLLSDVERLRRTDIADHALQALASSQIREVVLVGRRGPAEAAFTTAELLGLASTPGVSLCVPSHQTHDAEPDGSGRPGQMAQYKSQLINELPTRPTGDRSVVLRFGVSPVEIVGDSAVRGIRLASTGTSDVEEISCSLVIGSIGRVATPVKDLPFDSTTGVVPSHKGRVVDPSAGTPLNGVYVTGWVKRGSSGGIGSNKWCAKETVSSVLADHAEGRLSVHTHGDIAERVPTSAGADGWKALDAYERAAGREAGRPRVKVTDSETMLRIAIQGESAD